MADMQNEALLADSEHRSAVENAYDYIENFDILETITNVGNDEVFTPAKVCNEMLDSLPDEVWHNPNYKWLNPCTKNGIFEREIAIRLDKGLSDIMPDIEKRRKHILQNMIYAIGLTKFTSYVARRTLYYCSDATRKCDGILADDGHYVNGYAIGNGTWFDAPEGNIKTPDAAHKFGKDGKCAYCGVRNDSKYVDPLQREQYAYQFIHFSHPIELQYWLADTFFNGDKKMKFDIIIGNPPYQLSVGVEKENYAIPIYHSFIQFSKMLNPKYISMVIPARWYAGGRGLDDFRNEMLHDNRIKVLHDYPNATDCFPNVDISAGVCHFLWDRQYSGDCNVYTHKGKDIISTMSRPLLEKGMETFLRHNNAVSIYNKVQKQNEPKFDSLVSPQTPFGLTSSFNDFVEEPFSDAIKYYTFGHIGYIERNKITKSQNLIDKHKLYISEAYGERGEYPFFFLGKPFYGEPNSCCSQSYLVIGPFENKEQCDIVAKYIKTRFFRCLIMLKKNAQHNMRQVFQCVPIQKFELNAEIDWSRSISEIEQQLFAKYGFERQEINFIESMIRPME